MAAWTLAPAALAQSPIEGELQQGTGIAQNPPQDAIGDVIEDICPPGNLLGADLQARCNEIAVGGTMTLGGNDVPGAQAALQAMANEEGSAVGNTTVDTSVTQIDNIGARLSALRRGAGGVSVSGLQFDVGGERVAGTTLFEGLSRLETGGAAGDGTGRWGFFLNGNVSFGDKDATARESGFDFDLRDITGGVDYRVSDRFILGVALGYTVADADLDGNGGDLETDAYNVSGYASFYPTDRIYLDGVVGIGRSEHEQSRAIRYSIAALAGGTTTVNQTATAEFDSDQVNASIGAGYTAGGEGGWSYGPYARLDYLDSDVDGFNERIAGGGAGSGLALQVDSQEFRSLTLAIGGQVSKAVSQSWGVWIPNASAEWVHEFDNDAQNITGRFLADTTRTTFRLPGDDPDRDYFEVGVGMSAIFAHGRSAFIQYLGLLGFDDLENHSFSAGVRLEF